MAPEPTTPTREHVANPLTGDEDTLDDAPDITPRPRARSPEATRSLIEKRASSSTQDKDQSDDIKAMDETQDHEASAAATAVAAAVAAADEAPVEEIKDDAPNPSSGHVHRISVSDLDEVNLADSTPVHSRTTTQASIPLKIPEASSRSSSTARSISPSKTMSPPPPTTGRASPGGLPAMAKGFKSPFSWLSRGKTGDTKGQSPPLHGSPPFLRERQNTAASADLLVGKYKDSDEVSRRSSRGSLKDRFKEARYAAETGHSLPRENGDMANGRSASVGLGLTSPAVGTPGEEKSELTAGALTPTTTGSHVDWDLWQTVVYEGPAAVARTSPEELNAALASGIPHPIRGVVWQVLAGSKNDELERLYEELVARGTDKEKALANGHFSLSSVSSKDKDSIASSASSIHSEASTPASTNGAMSPHPSPSIESGDLNQLQNGLMTVKARSAKDELAKIQKLEKMIRRDLGSRTAYSRFEAAKDPEGLFSVCKAYALYDEAVGYAQGMNFIGQPLLLNMSRAEAFCVFVQLMSKYGMREMFIQDMPGLHLNLYQFERLLEDFEPAVYCHLNRRGVNANLYATQWFLTLFAYRFPLELVLRVYDLVLSEGLGAILKFGLVLMQRNRETLLGMKDMSQLCTFLKERIFDVYIDKQPSQKSILDAGFFGSGGGDEVYQVDVFVEDATSVKITQEMLQQYTTEWEEKVRLEKDRDTELESLRNHNSSLQQKVRRLEEHVEKVDTEHVHAASELIRSQVENEKLQDENESLRGQVEELKNVVQHQTEEVEARMKGDVEAVKQANQVVHTRNRELEEENEETTAALVSLKMEHANLNSELETLKQKWKNIQEMLNGK